MNRRGFFGRVLGGAASVVIAPTVAAIAQEADDALTVLPAVAPAAAATTSRAEYFAVPASSGCAAFGGISTAYYIVMASTVSTLVESRYHWDSSESWIARGLT